MNPLALLDPDARRRATQALARYLLAAALGAALTVLVQVHEDRASRTPDR